MPSLNFSEQELEDFLCEGDNLESYLGLKFIARQVKVSTGVIDILAYNNRAKMFVIIELKKDTLDFKAYEQINRYYYSMISDSIKTAERRGDKLYDGVTSPIEPRGFQKLLIGGNLHESLHYLVQQYEQDQIHHVEYSNTYYKLFGVDFESPFSFDWRSPEQAKIEGKLYV